MADQAQSIDNSAVTTDVGQGTAANPPFKQSDRNRLRVMVRAQAKREGMPSDLAEAVAHVETGFHPEMIGTVGEIGLMQVRPSTAAMLGFQGTNDQLASSDINIRYGVTYLAQAWRLANGDICRTLMKYRAGHGEERMTFRSAQYCQRAKIYLSEMKSELAKNFTAQDIALPAYVDIPPNSNRVADLRSKRPPKFHSSEEFWAWKEAQIAGRREKVHEKWAHMAGAKLGFR
jgi:soluble lytic murein transglycosylase-like protein